MAAVIDPATRVNEVHIEGLVSANFVSSVHSYLDGICEAIPSRYTDRVHAKPANAHHT